MGINQTLKSSQKIRFVDARPKQLFRRNLKFGDKGKDVELLNELLSKDRRTHIDPHGFRSQGYAQSNFGSNTERGLKRFQILYNLYNPNDENYSIFEEKSIKKMRELFGNGTFYLQDPNRLQTIPKGTQQTEWRDIPTGMGDFTDRVTHLFTAIVRYFFKGKPIFSSREYAFGSFFSIVFKRAEKSALFRLVNRVSILDDLNEIEILIKNGPNQEINDSDMEYVVHGVGKVKNRLFILITGGMLEFYQIERFRNAFRHYLTVILPIGDEEIDQFNKWLLSNNTNACLVKIIMLIEKITSIRIDETAYDPMLLEFRESSIENQLDLMGEISCKQARTLIKKLAFLMKSKFNTIEIRCKSVKIIPKTYYRWLKNDLGFRKVMRI